jgi:hypothetical protein
LSLNTRYVVSREEEVKGDSAGVFRFFLEAVEVMKGDAMLLDNPNPMNEACCAYLQLPHHIRLLPSPHYW